MDAVITILLILLGGGVWLASYVLVYKAGYETGHSEGFAKGWDRKSPILRSRRDRAWVEGYQPRVRTTVYTREDAARYGGNEDHQ